MKRIVIIAAIAALGIPAAAIAYRTSNSIETRSADAGAWSIVQYYKGDAFVIDHDLTHDDCDAMLPRNQAAKGLRFACELEA